MFPHPLIPFNLFIYFWFIIKNKNPSPPNSTLRQVVAKELAWMWLCQRLPQAFSYYNAMSLHQVATPDVATFCEERVLCGQMMSQGVENTSRPAGQDEDAYLRTGDLRLTTLLYWHHWVQIVWIIVSCSVPHIQASVLSHCSRLSHNLRNTPSLPSPMALSHSFSPVVLNHWKNDARRKSA